MKLRIPLRFYKPLKQSLLNVFGNVCFIGITGSCGKTTTTELISAILAKEGRVRKGSRFNSTVIIARTILAVSPRDRFCVHEVSGHAPGVMGKSAKLLQPQIGVVTHIGQDHYGNFRSLEATAVSRQKMWMRQRRYTLLLVRRLCNTIAYRGKKCKVIDFGGLSVRRFGTSESVAKVLSSFREIESGVLTWR